MSTLLSTVTTIIEHPNDPNNVIELPKKEQPRRLLVFVGRKEHDTFDDTPESPEGRGFWVEGFSKVHWDWLRTHKIDWFLNNSLKYPGIKVHEWLEGESDYVEKIRTFMLMQLKLDPNKYYVMTWSTHNLKPMPTLHEIQK